MTQLMRDDRRHIRSVPGLAKVERNHRPAACLTVVANRSPSTRDGRCLLLRGAIKQVKRDPPVADTHQHAHAADQLADLVGCSGIGRRNKGGWHDRVPEEYSTAELLRE